MLCQLNTLLQWHAGNLSDCEGDRGMQSSGGLGHSLELPKQLKKLFRALIHVWQASSFPLK